ncbi:Acetate operon repressor [Arthrobacter saudimassiliensis]|uniref:Acetate operon repressor n=1 Tax=Arthrobacter saudimassiliensis TaxID=1461584 RepID=A0A078MTS3_9MICC|nr:Acetate operon repressor [Arthrobacter saudimassiliensis]
MPETATRTVERALDVLGAVCAAGSTSLADAARAAGLSASTALRLLRTLEGSGFVRRDGDGGWRPGLRLVQLGAQALGHEELVPLAAPALSRLVAETGESAYLAVPGPVAGEAVYLAVHEGTRSVRHTSWVGRSLPLAGTAAGAALGGQLGEGGYAVADSAVEEDVTAVAAPVTAGSGSHARIVAALSVVAPSYRTDAARTAELGRLVADAAAGVLAVPPPQNAPAADARPAGPPVPAR